MAVRIRGGTVCPVQTGKERRMKKEKEKHIDGGSTKSRPLVNLVIFNLSGRLFTSVLRHLHHKDEIMSIFPFLGEPSLQV